ncbi:MAG: peptidoglycan DD-metalloendopeptidase family protein [Candidatus Woesearchaeota archaeon]
MDKQELTKVLANNFEKPITGMEKFPLGTFEELIRSFGTTDLHSLPGNILYEKIIKEGMILRYKEQRIYNGETYGYHWGIDILSPEGTPVFASDEGKVIDAYAIDDLTEDFGGETYGNYVVLQGKYGSKNVFTLYGHLANINNSYREGQIIAKGEQIGVLGKGFTVENGGWPPHLHFQVATSIKGLDAYGSILLEKRTINPELIFGIKS